jgi:hypothetical protein
VRPKIEPCPFCKKEKTQVVEGRPVAFVASSAVVIYWITCNNLICAVSGPTRSSKALAIKAWNRWKEKK